MCVKIQIKHKTDTNNVAFFNYGITETTHISGIVKRISNGKNYTYLIYPRYMNTVTKAYWASNWKDISDTVLNRLFMFSVFE